MTDAHTLAACVAAALAIYLVAALLWPERF